MNVAISTFVRRGYLLTALAVAVLLAGFSGAAWAQTATEKSFTLSITSSAVLQEDASDSNSTPDRTKLTITRSDPTFSHSYDHDDDGGDGTGDGTANRTVRRSVFSSPFPVMLTAECNGEESAANDDCPFSVEVVKGALPNVDNLRTSGSASVSFADATATVGGEDTIERTIELLVSHDGDDDDWNEEKLILTLEDVNVPEAATLEPDVTYSFDPARNPTSTLTIRDDDPMPKLKFAPPSIQLAKGNMLDMTVGVGIGGGGRGDLPTADSDSDSIRGKLFGLDGGADREGSSDEILLSVSPPDAVGSLIKIYKVADDVDEDRGTDLHTDRDGLYVVGKIGGANGAVRNANMELMNEGILLTIEAIDVSGFRDQPITFTLMDGRTDAQKKGDGGGIDDSDSATVTLLSGEATPTVTFSKSSVSIMEGESDTVHLLADTDQGDKVGSATVSMSGDALISLRQGNSAISGGLVSFGGSANAELTVVSLSDPDLEDGEEKTATVTITDASGANIGERRTLTVTVVGSTAVPVFPLFGQLLLALLLMVGGARLYRRRQQ